LIEQKDTSEDLLSPPPEELNLLSPQFSELMFSNKFSDSSQVEIEDIFNSLNDKDIVKSNKNRKSHFFQETD
jgi:hypothetical protein